MTSAYACICCSRPTTGPLHYIHRLHKCENYSVLGPELDGPYCTDCLALMEVGTPKPLLTFDDWLLGRKYNSESLSVLKAVATNLSQGDFHET